MDIENGKVLFTPSEAKWAQEAGMLGKVMLGLSQKLLDARVAYARPWLRPDQIPTADILTARNNFWVRMALNDQMGDVHKVTLEHATGERGQELSVIPVVLDEPEKRGLLRLAKIHNDIARGRVETPELQAFEDGLLQDDFAASVATSDIVEPERAVLLGDMLRDPAEIATYEQDQQEEALHTMSITGQVITALEVDLTR
jgi:hypothetical protein